MFCFVLFCFVLFCFVLLPIRNGNPTTPRENILEQGEKLKKNENTVSRTLVLRGLGLCNWSRIGQLQGWVLVPGYKERESEEGVSANT